MGSATIPPCGCHPFKAHVALSPLQPRAFGPVSFPSPPRLGNSEVPVLCLLRTVLDCTSYCAPGSSRPHLGSPVPFSPLLIRRHRQSRQVDKNQWFITTCKIRRRGPNKCGTVNWRLEVFGIPSSSWLGWGRRGRIHRGIGIPP